MPNIVVSIVFILVFIAGIKLSYDFGYGKGWKDSYRSISEDGFESNDIPWRVNIPTVDHKKRKVHIHVFPVALNTNEFVINIQSDDNERVVGAVVRSPE